MNLRQALDGAERQLTRAGLDNGRGEAEILLGRLVAATRGELYLRADEPFDTGAARTLAAWILRRQAGEPLQYVIGEAAYRDLLLEVGPGVFIPRPETELLVDEALAFLRVRPAGGPPPRVLECCTGSGAIAFALAAEWPAAVVFATELSPRALAYAARNRARASRPPSPRVSTWCTATSGPRWPAHSTCYWPIRRTSPSPSVPSCPATCSTTNPTSRCSPRGTAWP